MDRIALPNRGQPAPKRLEKLVFDLLMNEHASPGQRTPLPC